jgi:hypothetical protein
MVLNSSSEVRIMKVFRNLTSSKIARALGTSFVIALLLCSFAPAADASPLPAFQDRADRSEKSDRSAKEPRDRSDRGSEGGRDAGRDRETHRPDGSEAGRSSGDKSSRDRSCDGKDVGDKGRSNGGGGK